MKRYEFFLRLLIHRPNSQEVRGYLTTAVQGGGVELVINELLQVQSAAPAYAYLAMIIKDYGAVNESAELYRRAFELKSDQPTYCLNLVHVLEVCYRYPEGIEFIKEYCKKKTQQ